MKEKELSELTDQELLAQEKKKKSTAILNATLIGLTIGIIIYGVVKNNWSFFCNNPIVSCV